MENFPVNNTAILDDLDNVLGPYLDALTAGREPVGNSTTQGVVPYFSPKRRLDSWVDGARAHDVEALVRGKFHKVFPGVFGAGHMLSSAERLGKSDVLNWVMLRKACALLMERKAALNDRSPTRMSWNVPQALLEKPGFVQAVLTVLHSTKYPTDRLAVEVLETDSIASSSSALGQLETLLAQGVQVHIDDLPQKHSSANLAAVSKLRVKEGNVASRTGLKFGTEIRHQLCDDDPQVRSATVERIVGIMREFPFEVTTFEGGGDTPYQRHQTRMALIRALPVDLLERGITLVQGGRPVPLQQLSA